MSKLREYVEQVVRDGFVREAEADENVMRSLPFFATTLGPLAAVLGLLHGGLCRPVRSSLGVPLIAVAACVGVCVALAVGFLLQAVRARAFRYPMLEGAFVRYAAAMARSHRDAGADAPAEAALSELRATRIQQLAEAAEANRRNNLMRARARARARVGRADRGRRFRLRAARAYTGAQPDRPGGSPCLISQRTPDAAARSTSAPTNPAPGRSRPPRRRCGSSSRGDGGRRNAALGPAAALGAVPGLARP